MGNGVIVEKVDKVETNVPTGDDMTTQKVKIYGDLDNGYRNRGGYGEDCLADLINSNAMSDGFRGTTDSVYKSGNDAIAAIQQAQTDLNGNINRAGLHAVEATRDVGSKIQSDLCHGFRDVVSEVGSGFRNLTSDVHSGFTSITRDVNVGFANVARDVCEVRKEICDVKHEVAISTKEILLENAKCEGRTREELLKGFHATQLEALKNKCDLEAKLAACCCELEGKIDAQGSMTRELILAQAAAAKDTAIADLKLQVAILGNNNGNNLRAA